MALFFSSKWICSGLQVEILSLLICDELGTLNLACETNVSQAIIPKQVSAFPRDFVLNMLKNTMLWFHRCYITKILD